MGKFIKKIRKIMFALILIVLFFISQILFVIILAVGEKQNDIVKFVEGRYVIHRISNDYSLIDKDGIIILDHVDGYYRGKAKIYVSNHTDFLIINKRNGTYEKKLLSEANNNNKEDLSKLKHIKNTK